MWNRVPEYCTLDYVRNFVNQHGEKTIEEGDEKGRTPLMIACLHGNKEVVEYLLELGTGVNRQCTHQMNTPLHYTCYTCTWDKPERITIEKKAEKEAIAKLLFKHGASYKTNSIGLTPMCYAGLHQMKQLVNLFSESETRGDSVGDEVKIRGLEYLGVAYATRRFNDRDTSLAYQCILEAKQLRLAGSCPLPVGGNNEVEKLFQRSECSRVDNLEAIKEDREAIQIEGFLIGARIIPDELKPNYYWNMLLDFASSREINFTSGCVVISFFLQPTNITKMPLDNVLKALQDAARNSKILDILSDLNDVLTLCLTAVSAIYYSERWEEDNGGDSYEVLVGILTDAAVYGYGENVETLTATVMNILKVLGSTKPCQKRERVDVFPSSSFSPWVMIVELPMTLGDDREVEDDSLHQIKYVFSKLLELDGASQKTHTGCTLLHLVSEFLEFKNHYTDGAYELILSIIEIIIRHGCPVEARDSSGKTAKEWAEQRYEEIKGDGYTDFEMDDPFFIRFLEALSQSSSVLSLEELAARAVLKWRIPYRDYLPRSLHETVAGFWSQNSGIDLSNGGRGGGGGCWRVKQIKPNKRTPPI